MPNVRGRTSLVTMSRVGEQMKRICLSLDQSRDWGMSEKEWLSWMGPAMALTTRMLDGNS